MGDRGSILNLAGQSLMEVFLESNPELVSFHVHDALDLMAMIFASDSK